MHVYIATEKQEKHTDYTINIITLTRMRQDWLDKHIFTVVLT